MIKNLIVVGMGGQGIKLLSTLLRRAIGTKFGRFAGFDERGGAQRYGPVAAAIRFSDERNYDGPIALDFKDGGADWVLSLEASEALRYSAKLGKGTVLVTDEIIVPPTNVRRQDGEYFTIAQLSEHYESKGCRLFVHKFRQLAEETTSNPLDANLLALGFLLNKMDGLLDLEDFATIADERQLDVMKKGYSLGSNT